MKTCKCFAVSGKYRSMRRCHIHGKEQAKMTVLGMKNAAGALKVHVLTKVMKYDMILSQDNADVEQSLSANNWTVPSDSMSNLSLTTIKGLRKTKDTRVCGSVIQAFVTSARKAHSKCRK